jgi:hypothetical protein
MTPTTDTDRRQLAAYLNEHGATRGAALRSALGWEAPRFWKAVYGTAYGWFAVTPDGWGLTEQGRELRTT